MQGTQYNVGTSYYQNRYTLKKVGWGKKVVVEVFTDLIAFGLSVVFLIHRTVQWPTILPMESLMKCVSI